MIIRALSVLLVASLIPCLSFGAESSSPLQQALRIAEKAPRIQNDLKALRSEARKIHDPRLRRATLGILGVPHFELDARRADEAAIRVKLLSLGLLSPHDAPAQVIPMHSPMPFIAAPASPWTGHHSYPGGLVLHTLTNLRNSLALGRNWETIHDIRLDQDQLRAAPMWHDIAKTWTIQWNADGSSTREEGMIAGTPAHHVLGVAEALMRGFPPRFIVTLASAHSPANPRVGLGDLLGYLRAACVIAGKSYGAAGLTADGTKLEIPAPLESFIHHLSDHDYVGTEVISAEAFKALSASFSGQSLWKQDEELADFGDFRVVQVWREAGPRGVRATFKEPRSRRSAD